MLTLELFQQYGSSFQLFSLKGKVYLLIVAYIDRLMGGATYVNAFYLLSQEVEDKYKEFSLGLTSVANSIGISLCAVAAIGLQPWIRVHQHKKYI
jgi:hypothetical protein